MKMDVINGYRAVRDESDSDSDKSDEECTVWKRATKRSFQEVEAAEDDDDVQPQPNKRKRNTIWCDVLQDQLISEDLGECLLKNKPQGYGSRGVESYDYTVKYSDPGGISNKDVDATMSEDDKSNDSSNVFDSHEDKSVKPRRFFKKSDTFDSNKPMQSKKFVKLVGEEKEVAQKIVRTLSEKKAYLIYRVVKELGTEKALSLLKMTEDIEESGGMMIKNNARRRTPGGVYFQLLKSEKNVPQEVIDRIFEGEVFEPRKPKSKKKKTAEKKTAEKETEEMELQESDTGKSDFLSSPVYAADTIASEPKDIKQDADVNRSSDLEEGEIEE